MKGAVIAAARRSAVVPQGGAFRALRIEDMAAPVIAAVLADAGLSPDAVDEIVVSNALGAGGNPARRVALAAGLPERVAGLAVDRQCAGGLDAVLIARALVESGAARVVLAGGVESHSLRPLRAMPGPDGPVPYTQAPFTPWPDRDPDMAAAAEALGRAQGIDRAMADALAMESHARALAARAALRREIVPIAGQADDAFPRRLSPALAARAPVVCGSVTAANMAVAADAAAFVLVVADDLAPPGALRLLSGATLGADPVDPGLSAVPAMRAALARAGLRVGDLEQVELMEAFAVQAIACARALELGAINPRGGGLARGHPIGASGAVLVVRLFHDLAAGPGMAAIAGAGGVGSAIVLARG